MRRFASCRPYLLSRCRRKSSSANGSSKESATAKNAETSKAPNLFTLHPISEPPLLNPFPLLAHATENVDLTSRLRSYSNTFGIIGALMCTLSMQALIEQPISNTKKQPQRNEQESSAFSASTQKHQSILVKYLGLTTNSLQDVYMASWAISFYTSAIGLGLSTVVAGIVAATAPAYVKTFARRHASVLIALPICQALSGAFAMIGLTIGLDESQGEPVAWIGFVMSTIGTAIVGGSSFRVLQGYKASRAAGKLTTPKQSPPMATSNSATK